MEAGSDPGVMAGREPFSAGMPKTQVPVQPPPQPQPQPETQPQPQPQPQQLEPQPPPPQVSPLLDMAMAFAAEGASAYMPVTDTPNEGGGEGGAVVAVGGNGLSMELVPHGASTMGVPLKRKRGRPRKYGPDGTLAASRAGEPGAGGLSPSSSGSANPPLPASRERVKRARTRPSTSAKKQQLAALGPPGIGFTPHVILVKPGEDVSAKILLFSQHGPRAVCVLSSNGSISNPTLRPAAYSGESVTYEGRFDILSLSGSFLPSENSEKHSRTGELGVSLAGSDGRVLGGEVVGQLMAASLVQVVVGSFIADGRKENTPTNASEPMNAAGNLTFDGTVAPAPSSPPSRGTPSESSGGGPSSAHCQHHQPT